MQISKKHIVLILFALIAQVVFSLEIRFYDSISMAHKTGEILFDDNGIVYSGYYGTRKFTAQIETNIPNMISLVYTVNDIKSDYYSKVINLKMETLVDSIRMTTFYPNENVNIKMGREGKIEVEEFFKLLDYDIGVKSNNWMITKEKNIFQALRIERGMNHSYDSARQISDRWLFPNARNRMLFEKLNVSDLYRMVRQDEQEDGDFVSTADPPIYMQLSGLKPKSSFLINFLNFFLLVDNIPWGCYLLILSNFENVK